MCTSQDSIKVSHSYLKEISAKRKIVMGENYNMF